MDNGPHEANQLTDRSYDDLVGMLTSGDQASLAFTEPALSCPADVLDDFGLGFASQLPIATDVGQVPRDAQAPSIRTRRAGVLPAVVIAPCRRCPHVAYAAGIRSMNFMSSLGVS
jgi:hypothetical protein